jgi:hypothetical protein
MEGPRLRPNTALGVWIAGAILALVLSALGFRLDSPNMRDAAGSLWLLLLWEAFLKNLVLGWVLLPVALYRRRRARKRNVPEWARETFMKSSARTLVEVLDKDPSDRELLQKIIDSLDESNNDYYA